VKEVVITLKNILFLVIFPEVIEGLMAQSIQSARQVLLKKLGGLLVHCRLGLAKHWTIAKKFIKPL
jgi:hypothetical protein